MNRVISDWFKIWVVWIQMTIYSHMVIGQTIGDGQSIDEEHQIEIEGCESRKRSIFTNFAETEIEVDLRTSCHSCCCSNMTNQVSRRPFLTVFERTCISRHTRIFVILTI